MKILQKVIDAQLGSFSSVLKTVRQELDLCLFCKREELPEAIREEVYDKDLSFECAGATVPFFEVVLQL